MIDATTPHAHRKTETCGFCIINFLIREQCTISAICPLLKVEIVSNKEAKTATVSEAKLFTKGAYRRLKARDWNQTLQRIRDQYSLEERCIDGVYYDPVEYNGQFLLGLHRPVDGSYKTLINKDTSSITDVMDDESLGDRWADSSAILFSNYHHVFIYASGGRSGPPVSSLTPFLNKFFPGGDQERWKIDPYFDRSQIDRLKKAKGLTKFSTKFSTQRDLLNFNTFSDGPASFADRIAEAVGQDVEIEISIKLPKHSRGSQSTRKFLDWVRGDLNRTVTENSNAKAEAIIDDELTEELSLVAHKMAAKFTLNVKDSEKKLFSDLLSGLVEVAPELNEKIRKIEEG